MDLKQANVLITGGSEGIGFGLASRFITSGSKVLITGRNAGKLDKASARLPGLQTFKSDIASMNDREALAQHIAENFSDLNIIVNNAGFQRRVPLANDQAPWPERQTEIDALLSGPVHLNHLLVPLILANGRPGLIVNVTSGGAYIPQVFAPVYSACKAALHSYTMTLRHALSQTNCRVAELIPPAVQTGLAGVGLNHGVSLDEFCDAVFAKLFIEDLTEVGFGPTANLRPELSGEEITKMFDASSLRFPVGTYTHH